MSSTLFHKICLAHGVKATAASIELHPDQVLIQDATGVTAFLQLEAMEVRKSTPFCVVYADHNTLQIDNRNADDHRYLRQMASRMGALFAKPGYGICHQAHLENYACPGLVLLGSDSHTPTAGALGMLGMGAGGLDVAQVLAGAAYNVPCPKVMGIRLCGTLPDWVGGKDVILYLLGQLTTKGGVGYVLEFFGPGVAGLDVFDRISICNMATETGATSALFPSDDQTLRYLETYGRAQDFVPLAPDPDAVYDRVLEIDLSQLEPMVALPHRPDHVLPVAKVAGLPLTQVMLGSCTNSSFKDLALGAAVLRGKHVCQDIDMLVSPGSRRTLTRLTALDCTRIYIEAGARVLEIACGPCNGIGQAPCSGGVSLRTSNRNFKGRCGTADAEVYLSGPAVAAASALTGRLTDPRTLGPQPSLPEAGYIPDIPGMVLMPQSGDSEKSIIRGPNIHPVPLGRPVPETLSCTVALKTGDNISTDDLLPGGTEMLTLRANIPASVPYMFQRIDPAFGPSAATLPSDWLVVGGRNFGQGSSREQAVMVPMSAGMRLILARSIARIFRKNCINNGVIPLEFACEQDYDLLTTGDTLLIADLPRQLASGKISCSLASSGRVIPTLCALNPIELRMLLAGGVVQYYKSNSIQPPEKYVETNTS